MRRRTENSKMYRYYSFQTNYIILLEVKNTQKAISFIL